MVVFSKSTQDLAKICKILRRGEVVAAPTETAYGLLVDATNRKAVAKLFHLKGRLTVKAVPLIVADLSMVKKYTKFSTLASKLARRFWPGPLTLVLPAKKSWPVGVVNKNKMMGLRVPDSKWLRSLVSYYGSPLTATSANRAGAPTIYNMSEVNKHLIKYGLKYIVKSRRLLVRPTSTVVKIVGNKWEVVRCGAISEAKLRSVVR